MAAIKALKVEMSATNKALSDSLTLKFKELKSEFLKVSKEVSELKTSYATLHYEVEELKGKVPRLVGCKPFEDSQSKCIRYNIAYLQYISIGCS